VRAVWGAMGSGRATSTGAWIYTCKAHHHLSRAGEPVDELVSDVVVGILSRPDAVAAITAPAEADGPDLNVEAVALRAQLDSLAVEFADGVLTDSQLRIGTERLRARLGEVETRMRTSPAPPSWPTWSAPQMWPRAGRRCRWTGGGPWCRC
jgi:site-specific DNA recombinase